jgi:hypothetical protein
VFIKVLFLGSSTCRAIVRICKGAFSSNSIVATWLNKVGDCKNPKINLGTQNGDYLAFWCDLASIKSEQMIEMHMKLHIMKPH